MQRTDPEYPQSTAEVGAVSDRATADIATWDQAIQASPDRAARRAIEDMRRSDVTDAERAVLQYAIARSMLELGRVDDAATAIDVAVRLAGPGLVDDEQRWAILMTSAVIHTEAGRAEVGLTNLAVLERECSGAVLARVRLQRAYVLHQVGRLNDALVELDQSDRLFTVGGTPRDRFRVHINRGLVLLQQGALEQAEADFRRAAELARSLGMTAAEGQCFANLGVLYGRGRRLLEAIGAFDRAREILASVGSPDRVTTGMEIDRAEVLMYSGLHDDAVEAARRALSAATPSGNAMLVGDALVMCARTELRAGLVRRAGRTAAAAREHLKRSARDDMATHTESIVVHAALQQAGSDQMAEVLHDSAHLVDRLRTSGWHQQADELTAERLRAAWRLDCWDAVIADVSSLRLHAFGIRRDLTLLGWFAEAVARHRDADPAGSIEACTSGLAVLDDIVAEADDLESRSAAMRLGHDLSRWIIEVAISRSEPDLVLAASEGTRARALHEELDGRDRHHPLTEEGAERLRTELRGRLRGRCLVHWVVAGERVHAIVCDESGNRLVDAADLRAVIRARDRLMVWLDRAVSEPDASSARAVRAAGLLDELLLAPLDLPSGDAVVIVPVDELHGIPWSGLPSIADRPVVVGPSCRLWLDADRRSSTPVRTIGFVSGPDLAGDDLERSAIERLHPRLDRSTGTGATAASLRAMFSDHDLVHVAAHGRFRADRPLLSTFELVDGEVTLHEVVPARVGTRLAVLSSCEGGAHRGTGGSEVLGLASVLLARGAASVLAPLTLVRDLECGEFVAAVHERLATGSPFGVAVADVRSAWLRDDDLSRWAVASSFTCFGSEATHLAS